MTGLTGGDEAFLPSRLAVDSIGRMYVVARNINRGIIQLDSEGQASWDILVLPGCSMM